MQSKSIHVKIAISKYTCMWLNKKRHQQGTLVRIFKTIWVLTLAAHTLSEVCLSDKVTKIWKEAPPGYIVILTLALYFLVLKYRLAIVHSSDLASHFFFLSSWLYPLLHPIPWGLLLHTLDSALWPQPALVFCLSLPSQYCLWLLYHKVAVDDRSIERIVWVGSCGKIFILYSKIYFHVIILFLP